MSNIIGLDLNIDQNYLEDAVKQTVMMGISESLNGKNEIVSQIVKMVLSTKVDEDGKISSYERNNRNSLLEFYVKGAIRDLTKEELQKIVEERKSELREIIRKELCKKSTLNGFLDSFLNAVKTNIDNAYKATINIDFKARGSDV